MSTYKARSAQPVETIAQLEEAFVPPSPVEGRVGAEWELLPLDKKGHMIAYAGPSGVERLLGRLAQKGFDPVMERGRIIALEIKGKGMIALEPGAQIEIASRPFESLGEIDRFFRQIHKMVRAEARPFGFDLFPWGLAPNDGPEATKDVPKARYAILKKHLETTGDRGRWMMKLSAATQISIDYMDETHLRDMVDGCMKLIPYLVALTANSPAANGRRSRWMSLRAPVWRRTDPKRCGLPAHLFSKGLSYGSLVRYAIERPPLFFVRGGRWVESDGRTFREILRRPGKIAPITMDDWLLHLSALFPDIRIRGYLEIRVLDSLPLPLVMAMAALLKGLMGRAGGFGWASRMQPPAPVSVRRELLRAARLGSKWRPEAGPYPAATWAELLDAAEEGLKAFGEPPVFLDPLRELAASGRCPAEEWQKGKYGWMGPEPLGGAGQTDD